jgi:hypothetical protein
MCDTLLPGPIGGFRRVNFCPWPAPGRDEPFSLAKGRLTTFPFVAGSAVTALPPADDAARTRLMVSSVPLRVMDGRLSGDVRRDVVEDSRGGYVGPGIRLPGPLARLTCVRYLGAMFAA